METSIIQEVNHLLSATNYITRSIYNFITSFVLNILGLMQNTTSRQISENRIQRVFSPPTESRILASLPQTLPQNTHFFSLEAFERAPRDYVQSEAFLSAFPNLITCPCDHITPELRTSVETATFENIESNFNNRSKEEPFTILSIGAGGCVEELLYIQKLATLGYTNIHLVVLDPSEQTTRALKELESFITTHIPNIHFSYERPTCSSKEDLLMSYQPSEDFSPQLVLLIDLDSTNLNLPKELQKIEERALKLLQDTLQLRNCVVSYAFHKARTISFFSGESLYIQNPDHLIISNKIFNVHRIKNSPIRGFNFLGERVNILGGGC
jgi:hypothetical protein